MSNIALIQPFPIPSATAFWAMVSEDKRTALLGHHVRRALQLLAPDPLPLPESLNRFELIIMLGVEAEIMFFNAALIEPSQKELDLFFLDFLRRSLQLSSA